MPTCASGRRRGPAPGKAQHDMVMNLRASATIADKEGFADQIGPDDAGLIPLRIATVHRARMSAMRSVVSGWLRR